ncbi:MAG: hypothetical protein JWO05_2658 [Gemmatimonadetes bacterium]|nr:hypothetical protein [Gemmatimonadota bacterium]
MNKRSLVLLLVGTIATLTALLSFDRLRNSACENAGGAWNSASRVCTAGGHSVALPLSALSYIEPLLLGLVVGFMLLRVYALVTGRRHA